MTLLRRVKGAIARRYPAVVAAYHDARMRRGTRQFVLAQTSHGFKLAGPAGMSDGAFEPLETAFLAARLAASDVFIDVGANVGYFACLARQRGVHVVAIEPAEQNLQLLFANLQANGWSDVEVFPLALGREPGVATLYGDGTSASLVSQWAGMSAAWRRHVPMSTLDVVAGGRFAGQRLLIKVDVEGFEYETLCGAHALLTRTPAPTWLVEVCFSENFAGGINPRYAETFELFWKSGYTARSLEADRLVERSDVERWVASGRRDFGYVSFVFERAGG